ncbi:MAG: serine/threonine protein kinase, partial [Microcystaceae cyanobacterium]
LKELDAIEASLAAPPAAIPSQVNNDLDNQQTVVSNFKPGQSSQSKKLLPAEELCKQMEWPADKPLQKIVFPHILRAKEGNTASLWAMLDQADILTRMNSIRYNQFLLMTNPHPMILWITVLYHRDYGPRWFPCYLDLKTSSGQRFANLLGELGQYWILFFGIENPQTCQQVLSATVAPNQCKLLQEWAISSQNVEGGKPQITKRLLKQEFEKLKPKIVAKLSTVNSTISRET